MNHDSTPSNTRSHDWKVHGYVAEYGDVDSLVHACEKVRDAGYTKWDAHSPFPVHGIDDAMGIKPTILPWIVLGGGLTGLLTAIVLQWWTNAIDYPFMISGKPMLSVPAWIPVCFELTVLLSAISAFLSVLVLNVLPTLYHPLFNVERFKRATDDKFFVSIEAADPLFHETNTKSLLAATHPAALETCMDETKSAKLPIAFHYVGALATLLTFIPLALIYKARFTKSDSPRVHLVWDMDWQPKYKTQKQAKFTGFADHRTMRQQVPGTVAWGDDPDASPLTTGKDAAGNWITNFPLQVDAQLMARGEERFGVYCAPCHGLDGAGTGTVAKRAELLLAANKATGWTRPASLVGTTEDARLRRDTPNGELFNTITNGKNTMLGYAGQIPAKDRWAIVLYVRALQRSKFLPEAELPPELKDKVAALPPAGK